jgi:phasin family protein
MAKQPESILDMLSKLGAEMKLPKVDVEAALDNQRKNLEALEKSARAAAAGASTLLDRQREMLKETLNDVAAMAQSFSAPGNAQELMARQAEFARKSFEAAVKNAGEAAEIVRKSGSESIDILRERIRESMDEIRAGFDKRK